MRDISYFPRAIANEAVFRNILRDLIYVDPRNNSNRDRRPMGFLIPKDLDTESDLEAIFDKYSRGEMKGKFTIADFTRNENLATIAFVVGLSGPGAELEYLVNADNSIKYKRKLRAILG